MKIGKLFFLHGDIDEVEGGVETVEGDYILGSISFNESMNL